MLKKRKKPVEKIDDSNIDIAIEERTENKEEIKPSLTPIQKYNADLQITAESLQLAINDFGANQRYGSIDRLILSQKQLNEIIERTKGLC